MVSGPVNYVTRPASLSVSVNLKNPQEVKVLRKMLAVWTVKMIELEISFKVCLFHAPIVTQCFDHYCSLQSLCYIKI